MATKTPVVVDMFAGEEMASSHTGSPADFRMMYAAGIRGVIHKSSQGATYRDKECLKRIPMMREAGLLTGLYHFGTSASTAQQVHNFLGVWQALGAPDDMLLALDYEKNEPNPPDSMAVAQAKEFLKLVYEQTGQRPVLYSGNLIKEKLANGTPDPFILQHRLWIAHYAERPTLPRGFGKYFLHQFTGDGHGPFPHEIAGCKTKGIDLNVFGGDDMVAEWVDRDAKTDDVTASGMGGAVAGAASTAADEPIAPTVAATVTEAKSGFWERFNFSLVNDFADQGSRLAGSIRTIKTTLHGLMWGPPALGGGAVKVAETGTGQVAAAHPNLMLLILGMGFGISLAAAIVYLIVKFGIEPHFASAAKDKRYAPRGAQPVGAAT